MSIQLQEIQSIFISQNRLVEGKDYVRAEWLKKSGLARIDIPTNYNMVDSVTCYFKHYGGQQGQMPIFGGDKTHALLWKYNSSENRLDTYFNSQYYFDTSVTEGKFKVQFNWQTKKRLISWNDVNKGGWLDCVLDKSNTKISVLDAGRFTGSWITHTGALAMKYFFLAPNIYLYPCQLLQDIPATLDANGIARQAGECGMIESISGKFYGNVASSGSFTVENLDESGTVEDTRLHQIYTNKLVEGEDYMVGEMLKANIPVLGGVCINLPINSYDVEFTRRWIQLGHSVYMQGQTYSYAAAVTDNVSCTISVFDKTRGTNVNTSGSNPLNRDILVRMSENNCVIDGIVVPQKNLIDSVILNSVSNSLRANIFLTSAIKVNGTIRFIPCKLLRSIPRNLDAQCKSRSAGECGMIDLISGRFYGNISESGTFSLAWDEWLKDCSIQIAIPSCYAFGYTTRVDTTKLTSELVDFGIIKLSNTQIVYGDEDDGVVYTVDWGTNKWTTLNIIYNRGAVATILNGTTVGTSYNTILDRNPHIQLYDIMQIKQIDWSIMEDNIVTTTTLTRYVDEDTGQQGLISDQDGTIIYAD